MHSVQPTFLVALERDIPKNQSMIRPTVSVQHNESQPGDKLGISSRHMNENLCEKRESSLLYKRAMRFWHFGRGLLAVTKLIKDSAELAGSCVPVISVAWLIRRWCFFRQLGARTPMPKSRTSRANRAIKWVPGYRQAYYLCRSCLTQVHLVNPLFYYPTLVGCRFLSTVGYLSTAFVCGTHNEPVDLHKSRLPVPTENGMIRRSRVYQQPVHSANLFLALRNNDDPASR